MSGSCCPSIDGSKATDPLFKRTLWFALVVNAAMFLIEFYASEVGDSVSLKADALDFLGDAANYAISLFVVASSLATRAKASIVKAVSMLAFGTLVLVSAIISALLGSAPIAHTIGLVGFLALVANVAVAAALYRYRGGDSNMQSVWLCSRNDAIGNLAVIAAGIGVYLSATRWPDLVVAVIIATLAISSAVTILKLALSELNQAEHHDHTQH